MQNSPQTFMQVIANISAVYPEILLFLEAFAYALGAFFFVISLFHLSRQHGGGTKASINDHSWLWGMVVSILLFTIPSVIDAVSLQAFKATSSNPLAYTAGSDGGPVLAPLAGALKLFGIAYAIQGLRVLRLYGIHGLGQGRSIEAGSIKIIAGALLVNLELLMNLIKSITGLNVGAGLFY